MSMTTVGTTIPSIHTAHVMMFGGDVTTSDRWDGGRGDGSNRDIAISSRSSSKSCVEVAGCRINGRTGSSTVVADTAIRYCTTYTITTTTVVGSVCLVTCTQRSGVISSNLKNERKRMT